MPLKIIIRTGNGFDSDKSCFKGYLRTEIKRRLPVNVPHTLNENMF